MWADDAFVYHVYPLGACAAPPTNDLRSAPVPRLDAVTERLDHIAGLGATALQLGPVFESTAHGYDTADYFTVDRRLGDDATLRHLSAEVHRRGMRLVLDGVLNHVGRDFWAFRDVRERGPASPYAGWFHLDFAGRSPYDDDFAYEGWAGHHDLVKLDVDNPQVREHLFAAVAQWIERYDVAGLRLDAADVLSADFVRALAAHARRLRDDIWLVGEMVSGDYTRLAGPGLLDGCTNYELYKSLWSAHADRNYFELAFALNRQYGPDGIYRGLRHGSFADNHDVDRVGSSVGDPAHLYPLYGLLLTVPGTPSVYYGSEWGVRGRRSADSDRQLRPAFAELVPEQPALADAIRRLARLRAEQPALRHGSYRQLHVAHEQLAFARTTADQEVVVAVNAATDWARVPLGEAGRGPFRDLMTGEVVAADGEGLPVPPMWLRAVRAA